MSEQADPSVSRIEAVAKRLDAWGCSDEEVEAVRRDQGVVLPQSYEAFLRFLGRDGGGLMGGTNVCYGETFGVREAAIALLEENRELHANEEVFWLPADAVVISMHQGYAFEFVRSSLGNDPPVEWWAEGSGVRGRATVGFASIAEWLEADERSTSSLLSPEQIRSHKLSTQASRRRRFQPESCPSCGGELRWSGRIEYKAGVPDSGRDRQIAFCAAEDRTFWRWGDEPRSSLQVQ